MNILFTGATGFIGKPLTFKLLSLGHSVHAMTRSTEKAKSHMAELISQFPDQLSFFQSIAELDNGMHFDAVINLAGEGIANRLWTTAYKHKLWNSRVQLTQDLSHWIRECASPPKVFISGSATGYYGDQTEHWVYEETKGTQGFTHALCRHWEQAALSVTRYGCRVCCLRIGIVLANDGGFIQRLRAPCSAGIGAIFGSGRQWLPWIHRDDLHNIILEALENDAYFSTINAVSLTPSSFKEVSTGIGRRVGSPFWIYIPRWLIKPFIGEMSHLFFDSVKASPNRLTGFGYQHLYPELDSALEALFK